MIGTLIYDDKGKIATPLSGYQPAEDVKTLTQKIGQDFQVATTLQNRSFTEFNDESLLSRADIDQKRWNAYRQPQSEDIDEAWRWNGIRPITRNRILGILAQMTANIVIPAPFAQNEQDEIDRAAAQVMRDLMEYNVRNSNYVDNYVLWLTDALVNPISYLGTGFFESMQTIKEENEGKISKKDVLDGITSGFQTYNVPFDEVMVSNFYQKVFQRQRFYIRRRFIDYDEAKSLKGDHKNFEYVQPGVRIVYDNTTTLFYDVFDEALQTLVEETTYYNRREDIEVQFMNGVYVGDDDPEANPIKHRDNENRPKYALATLGFEDITSRFFYYKSAAWKLGDDDELVIRTEQLLADATFLGTMPPIVTTGAGEMNEAIMIPGKTTTLEIADAKITPIHLGSSIGAAMQLLMKKDSDASESSLSPILSGSVPPGIRSALEIAFIAQQAKVALGRFGLLITNSLKKFGELMIDVILQHQTIGEVQQLSDGQSVQVFKTFLLSTTENGQLVNKKISFKPDMIGQEMTQEDLMNKSEEVLQKEGGIDGDTRIYEVNPDAWRKLKYTLSVDVEQLLPLSAKEAQQNAQNQLMAAQGKGQPGQPGQATQPGQPSPFQGGQNQFMKTSPPLIR